MKKNAALVLIDIQKGFSDPSWGSRNEGGFASNVARLLASWRETGDTVFHVQHLSERADSPLRGDREGVAFMDYAEPHAGEIHLTKKVNSAFLGTPLDYWLRRLRLDRVVLVGISTDHCISTSARMGANLGYQVTVVSDATFAFERKLPDGRRFSAEEVHLVSLASLSGEFAKIVTTEECLRS
jgi:nicotinamidase-related amidase